MKNLTICKKHLYALTFALLSNVIGFSQTTLPLSRTTWNSGAPIGWTDSGTGSYTSSFACSTNNGGKLDGTGDFYEVFFNTTPDQLSYTVKISGSAASSLLVEESTDGSSWTTIVNHTSLPTTCTTYNYSLNSASRYVRWMYTKTSQNLTIDDVSITQGSIGPSITVSPASLTGFTYLEGSGPSAEQSFDVSGTNLTNDITVTPPTNWEVSTTSGGPYQTTAITLAQSGGNVASTTIYTRMVSGLLNANSPFSGNVECASTGATTQNVAVDGTVTLPSGTSCSELFISEYVEGSSNNKYIEIFNPTGGAITLTGVYDIAIYSNGSTSPSSIALTGSIPSHGVYVLANSSAGAFTGTVDQTSGSLNFNGNDAVALVKNGNPIDVIGQIGFDPGSEWTGTTCTEGTAEGTLVRNFSVDVGDSNGSDAFDPDVEWTCYAQDTVSDLGTHSSTCSACTPTHTISGFTPSSGAVGDTVTISGTGFTVSSTVQFNGTSATVAFVNSTTLTATVPTGATTGVITVTEGGCPVDSTSDFTVTACVPSQTITSFAPTTGPEGTEVTITGTGFTMTTTVAFAGVSATVISQTATQLVAEVPVGAGSGSISISDGSCPVNSGSDFTVLDRSNCALSNMPAGFTDLMFSGVYDDETDSCHYIELLNPTTSDIDLSAYTLGFENNFTFPSAAPVTGFNGTVPLSGIIPAESTFMVQVTTVSGGCASCPSLVPDYVYVGSYGLNVDDRLVLVKDYGLGSAAVQDVWQNHSAELADPLFDKGYVFARDFTATAPSATFNLSDWAYDGNEDCFGFALASTPPPTVDSQPSDVTSCAPNTFSISASAGNGGSLTYQWKYNDGTSSGWSDVTGAAFSPGSVTGETTDTLTISGFNLQGYQFYCAVTEGGSCTVASDAAQYKVTTAIWDGSSWSTGSAPTISDNAVIAGNYNTSVNGSFSACQLFVETGNTLSIGNSTYVEVENDAVVYGVLNVSTQGAFVQNNDSGIFVLDVGGNATVFKATALKQAWYYYTYWSSPVENETIAEAFPDTPADRRFLFDASQYLDADGNDIDDDGNDWQIASGTDAMVPGVGYAATSSPLGFYPSADNADFQGAFNTGSITTPISYNAVNSFSWNFIGNPYPSAIDFDLFYAANSSVVGGAAYFWSQSLPPDADNPGNQQLNFNQNDYAIYTVGSGGTASANGNIPDKFVPSAQGFFIEGLANANVTFNNAMRVTDNNTNFYRLSSSDNTRNRIWVNLTSDNGVFNQILVAYTSGATNAYDGSVYDAPRNLSTGQAAIIYTTIDNNSRKYAIQGKSPASLSANEIIPIGFENTITVDTQFTISLAQLEGDFMTNTPIYLVDNLLGVFHDLTQSDYSFTSGVGAFEDRFEIRFANTLSNDEFQLDHEVLLVDATDSGWSFHTNRQSLIDHVVVYDLLGRELANLTFKNQTRANVSASSVGSSIYLAKVTTASGQVFTRKIVKAQ